MTSSNTQSRDVIADEAADWFVANRGGSLERNSRAAFIAWLKASPLHVEEYLRIAAVARDLAAAADDPQVDVESLLAQALREAENVVARDPFQWRRATMREPLRWLRLWPRAAMAAAILLLVAAATIWSMRDGERFGLPKTYRTARAEQRVQQLPDGSVLHLNTDSAITVRYSRGERIVDLDRGQAFFEVAHEDPRRFRVQAGPAAVVAVGTQFDVYRKSRSVLVTVAEGTVAVFAGSAPPLGAAIPLARHSVRLGAGYQLEVSDRIGAPRHVDALAAVAWLKRQIAFQDEPLGEVAAEFNRYGRVALEIDDQTLRDLPISGVFDVDDTDSFAAFLGTLNGVAVQKTPTRIRVWSLSSTDRERQAVAH
jgi:transmembrane sensor